MLADIEPLRILQFEFARLAGGFVALLPNLLAALIVLALTWALARYAWRGEARLLRRWHQRPALIAAARTLTRSFIWIGGLIVAAVLIFPGMSATNVVAGLGVGLLWLSGSPSRTSSRTISRACLSCCAGQ